MSIEDVIHAWKADKDEQNTTSVANPVGEELSDQELQEITGALSITTITITTILTTTTITTTLV